MMPFWVKWVVLVGILAASHGSAFWLGGEHSRKVAAETALKDILRIAKDSQERQKKLQESLDKLPKSERTIREKVRNNPAPCERPKPVSDGLREAIDKANRAREMSSDS